MVSAAVRFIVTGFHYWPDAPVGRAYLGRRHRHAFHCEVRVRVEHDDRDVEFHDLLEHARRGLGVGDLGSGDLEFAGASCETLAQRLIDHVNTRWPGRCYHAEVWEDGEVGALVTHEAAVAR